ncbi:hypothetical protein KH5H1_47070 [Corallococcus caeni]|nr:hypothetical protein KH5H1_47070 [Corallococcus sp. KH5-1]
MTPPSTTNITRIPTTTAPMMTMWTTSTPNGASRLPLPQAGADTPCGTLPPRPVPPACDPGAPSWQWTDTGRTFVETPPGRPTWRCANARRRHQTTQSPNPQALAAPAPPSPPSPPPTPRPAHVQR